MVPSVQRKLFQSVDEQMAFYVDAWEQLHAQLSDATPETASQNIQNALLKHRGVKTQVLSEHMPLVYGELATGADSTLLFYQRCDARFPALQEVQEVAALLAAIEACQKVAGRLPVNIKWLLDGGGKPDNPELSRCLEEHGPLLQADAAIWSYADETGIGKDSALLALGTKGLLSVELAVQTGSAAIDIMHSGIVPNALWRLVWALNSLKDAQEDVKIEGFYDAGQRSTGTTLGHATLPDGPARISTALHPSLDANMHGYYYHEQTSRDRRDTPDTGNGKRRLSTCTRARSLHYLCQAQGASRRAWFSRCTGAHTFCQSTNGHRQRSPIRTKRRTCYRSGLRADAISLADDSWQLRAASIKDEVRHADCSCGEKQAKRSCRLRRNHQTARRHSSRRDCL